MRIVFLIVLFTQSLLADADFANGMKIGEVSDASAIIWTRLTDGPARFTTTAAQDSTRQNKMRPPQVAPGIAGEVRLTLYNNQQQVYQSSWVEVDTKRDFTHQFKLQDLEARTHYNILIEAKNGVKIKGSFTTAPKADKIQSVECAIVTCQAVRSAEDHRQGHSVYKQMLQHNFDFFIHTGDILYYDKGYLAKNREDARRKWNHTFALPLNRDFSMQVPSFFMKDDHDTVANDSDPNTVYGNLTFTQGIEIFKEQVPVDEHTYRRVRWGKDIEIWITENRDYRSINKMPDGPSKTILGEKQKSWLKKTIAESDASFKFIVTPGPIIGPDKKGKNDNHANPGFFHEGEELRKFIASQKNLYVICGDRHWQYASTHPKYKIREFGCGPINGQHMFGGHPKMDPEWHEFLNARGGFLSVKVERKNNTPQAILSWYDAELKDDKSGKQKINNQINLQYIP
ncbi:alkaline phosphatase D family protein [Lentisphaera profundi]|uniref:Alkaline phosphatase D family protein n=1 Tax=Lentisphaera profundi TaxID=1658616 RepID=A0ABY7VW58_9BACT|nr:alkaline phosphatase D family protein [Lentisphaera profundi]WDE96298.1 alkaline phosphatase D family protein [Lentisphaera profundi]